MTKSNPKICPLCGKAMRKAGYGKYPYECTAKDKHPNAMIYKGCEGFYSGTCKISGWDVDTTDIRS